MSVRTLLDLYSVRKNLHLKPSELKMMQAKKLRNMIEHSYRNVPFYHAKLKNAGVKPSDVRTVEDLAKIPMTTKDEIQGLPLSELTARDVDVNACVKNKTSGSTGMPLITLVDERTLAFDRAIWLRSFFEDGVHLWDKRVSICDPRTFPKKKTWTQHLGIMRTEYVSIFDDAPTQFSFLEAHNPGIIESYPSSLVILAHSCKQLEINMKPRLIFTLAELLSREDRRLISSTFNAELFDYYGSSELSLMAWECRDHAGYHMNVDALVMEFLHDGEAAVPGDRGEIVCTTLVNHAMPLIRYRVGDIGIPVQEQCSCGITLPLMKIMEGRTDDFLVATDGRIIPPTVFFPYPFENVEEISEFRVIQERKDFLRIQLVAKGTLPSDQVFEKVRREIHRVFGEDMQVNFQIVDEIERDPRGKLRKIISHVPAFSS